MPDENAGFGEGDRELLIRVAEKVDVAGREIRDIKKAIHGNGQPGLITRIAKVETRLLILGAITFALAGLGGAINI